MVTFKWRMKDSGVMTLVHFEDVLVYSNKPK